MLKEQITEDMKKALKERDKIKLSTTRLLLSELKNAEIAKGRELEEEEVFEVVNREIRRRNEAKEQYEKGGRPDLFEKENKEAEILKGYLPPQLSEEEIANIVAEAITETGASTLRDMGRVMGLVMPKVKGRAEGAKISEIVKARLSGQT